MKIHIVCYEDLDGWILGKFALKLRDNLHQLKIEADISKKPDPVADINHHIIYINYDGKPSSLDTISITHIDEQFKRDMLIKQLQVAPMGICFSAQTVQLLAASGLPREKLCFINPAHDGVMRPRKITVGITSKVQPSGCKREYLIRQIAGRIDPGAFRFIIMGAGWHEIVGHMRSLGVEVEYFDQFNYNEYVRLVPAFDYYLYAGWDEGSMGFIDAMAAGVRTIVTPQGYHLDAHAGIDHPFDTIDQLEEIFREISKRRQELIDCAATWTWLDYARRHAAVWEYLLLQKAGKAIPASLEPTLREMGIGGDPLRPAVPSAKPIPSRFEKWLERKARRFGIRPR